VFSSFQKRIPLNKFFAIGSKLVQIALPSFSTSVRTGLVYVEAAVKRYET